jgi:hypothetical protein
MGQLDFRWSFLHHSFPNVTTMFLSASTLNAAKSMIMFGLGQELKEDEEDCTTAGELSIGTEHCIILHCIHMYIVPSPNIMMMSPSYTKANTRTAPNSSSLFQSHPNSHPHPHFSIPRLDHPNQSQLQTQPQHRIPLPCLTKSKQTSQAS